MKRLTFASTFALCLTGWLAVAKDGIKETAAYDATEQNAAILLQRPDFVATVNGKINNTNRCSHCDRTHTNWFLQVEPVAATELARGKEMLGRALKKYPTSVVTSNLDRVFFVRTLEMNSGGSSDSVAGTIGLRCLYLATQAWDADLAELVREAVFHHEFNHLLLRSYKARFSEQAWGKCNPDGFSYFGFGHDYDHEYSPLVTPQYLGDGFVSSYGRATCQEDVATYAMWLFTRSDWILQQTAPRVRAKCDMLVAFYGSIDPFFTFEHFRRNCQFTLASKDQETMKELASDISKSPRNAHVWQRRACFYKELGLYEEALADANKALSIHPQCGYGYAVRGSVYSYQGRVQEAIGDFNKALTSAEITNDMVWVAHVSNQLMRAQESLKAKSGIGK